MGIGRLLGFLFLQIIDKMSDDENFIFTPGYTKLNWSDENIASIFTSGLTPLEEWNKFFIYCNSSKGCSVQSSMITDDDVWQLSKPGLFIKNFKSVFE